MKKPQLIISAAVLIATVLASPAHAREDHQLWTGAGVSVKLSDKWRISQDWIARFSDKRNGLYEIEVATLAGYKFGKSITVAAGYVHNPQYSEGDFSVLERRAREQVTFDNVAAFAGGKLSARIRAEQRWRENADGVGWRLRPYLKYSLPFNKGSKTSLTLSNETFVNLNTTGFQRTEGFDRMRNLIAVNTSLAKSLSVEAGYLNQYGFVRDGDDTIDHVASLALSLSL
ncbi:MAG TPA: DUF2490 domain-containing protein [Sphingomicrobium sp.]|nr:DUF2490 domain-containing protein [Sphingomicrobium sp.]